MRMTAMMIFILMSIELLAPESNTAVIIEGEAVRPYEAIWKATCIVESNNNPLAIGDGGKSFGIAQIQKVRIDDFYKRTGIRYNINDCFNSEISKQIFIFYACQFSPNDYRSISIDWNKSTTDKYYLKVQKVLLSL